MDSTWYLVLPPADTKSRHENTETHLIGQSNLCLRNSNSLVVVADTVNPALSVYIEGQTLQALSTDDTAKTGRVVGLPMSLQDL